MSSPIDSLYRDVLAVTFRFLSLVDLAAVVAVSRRWSEAVVQMSGIGASVRRVHVRHALSIPQSGLMHHVASWFETQSVSAEDLACLATQASSLTSLDCRFESKPMAAGCEIRFPPSLRALKVNLPIGSVLSCFVDGLAALTQLRRLSLLMTAPADASVDFLCRLPQLEELVMRNANGRRLELSAVQLDTLRQLPHLMHVDLCALLPDSVAHLLRSPLPAHVHAWKTISTAMQMHAQTLQALQVLPSLTHLSAGRFDNIAVLGAWPLLAFLEIDLYQIPSANAEVVAALQGCTRLTRLALTDCQLTNEDLALIFPAMPELRSLRVGWMPQLSRLSSMALAPNLTELDISFCRNPALCSAELRHLHTLPTLTHLFIHESCVRMTGDEDDVALLEPPSTVLPKLLSLFYEWSE